MIQKHSFLTLLLLLLASAMATAQGVNTLSVPDIETPAASSVQVPVQLDNTDQVVAMQFTLTVPAGVTLDTGSPAMTQRAADHTAVVRQMATGTYMVMVYSPTNAALQGRTGAVLNIGAQVGNLNEGTDYPMALSDVTLSTAAGVNVATGSTAGRVIITPSPDLTVEAVAADAATLMPGTTVGLSWKVSNIGGRPTGGGWSERLSLVTASGASKHIATVTYDGTLAAGAAVSRTANVRVPDVLGLDGPAMVSVQVVPNANCGEKAAKQGNNTATGNEVTVGKLLSVQLSPAQIAEANGVTVKGIVTRSGDWSMPQTFTLATPDSRLSLPDNVTIPAGQSSAYFYITVTANGTHDANNNVAVIATGGGYDAATASLAIDDDVPPALHVEANPHEINEGDTFKLRVTLDAAEAHDVVLNVGCDKSTLFTFPATATLKAGRTSLDIEVTSLDDDVPNVSQAVTFTVSATGFTDDETYVTIADNDLPEIELTLTPTTVSEGAGPQAINARLRRVGATDNKITIRLSDDSAGDIYYPMTSITLDKGIDTAEFTLGVVDNGTVEGERVVNITAAVYIQSCSCQATAADGGTVTVPVTITDNDGPSLMVATSLSTVLEGGSTVVTVTRNTPSTSALTVSLSSNADDALEYAHTVTIPTGQASATVNVAVRANSVEGDSRVIEMRAQADGHAVGTAWFMVSDQTLPDAVVRGIDVAAGDLYVGDAARVSVTLANEGAAAVPSQAVVAFHVDGASEAAVEARLADALPAGGTLTLEREVPLPAIPGSHTVKVVVNRGRAFAELNYTNNEATATAEVLPQFAVSVTADKATYAPGETVTLSGRVTGRLIGGQTVEVYVISGGLRQTVEAVSDASGNISATWTPASGQMGHFTAGACYPGENVKDAQTEFDIYGLAVTESYQTAQMTVGEPFTGSIKIANKGSLAQSGITVNVLQGADNITTDFATISTLAGGAQGSLSFTLNATSATDNGAPDLYNGWQPVKLEIVDAEGAATAYTLYCYAAMPTAKLEPSLTSIKTTVPKDGTHDVEFTIHNVGRGASGPIELSLPPYITSLTPATLPSLAFDESTTVALRFAPAEGMELSQIAKGTIGINCEGGAGVAMPFEFEMVSDAMGTLTVDVTDEYTYYTAEKPHVAGATVTIQHPVTNAIIAQGVTGADGRFTVSLNEGYYNVLVTEKAHDSASKTVLVDPGRENVENIFIFHSGIEISYDIVETEVEDVYEIITTVTYETNVPRPEVYLYMPNSIDGDNMRPGESILIEATVVNKGLITAKNAQLVLPEHPLFTFTPMWEGEFDLAANQSRVIPIVITRNNEPLEEAPRRISIFGIECHVKSKVFYTIECDENNKLVYVPHSMRVLKCEGKPSITVIRVVDPPVIIDPPIIVDPPRIEGGWDGPSGWSDDDDINICNPCLLAVLKAGGSCIVDALMYATGSQLLKEIKAVYDAFECGYNTTNAIMNHESTSGRDIAKAAASCLGAATLEAIPFSSCVMSLGDIYFDCGVNDLVAKWLSDNSTPSGGGGGSGRTNHKRDNETKTVYPSYVVEFFDNVGLYYRAVNVCQSLRAKMYGDESWNNCDATQLSTFVQLMNEYGDNEIIEGEALATIISCRPENISEATARSFISRWNNTLLYYKGEYDRVEDTFALENYDEEATELADIHNSLTRLGYSGFDELITKECDKFSQAISDAGGTGSVCSTITLEFKQTLSLTRQAFLGTLTVKNNNESTAIEDFQLHLEVRDPQGNLAGADKMEIHTKSLDTFTGNEALGSGWTLDAGKTGIATVEYIPTDKAAPETDVPYTFGGTVSFIDPYTGLAVTRALTPQTLTVRPCPQLYLDYFMQRDVLGDDPLTADVVEPSLPAEFALLINNRGAGDANNVKITTQQPVITENEKGLLIDFALFNGKEAGLVMSDKYVNDFGTITAGDHALAQWYLKSSLLGHFTSYDVEVNHVTGFNNPDLSLVKQAAIHELIHEGVDVEQAVAFLVNDDVDADDTPDHLYTLNGNAEAVAPADMTAAVAGESQVNVTLRSDAAGTWVYGNAIDPMHGTATVTRVVRNSDGAEVPVANVWLTDRTLRDGKDPLYEYRIHIMDKPAAATETYTVTMTPVAQPVLEVEAIEGMETTAMNMAAVQTATVRFNKPINAATFTAADVQLRREGENLDTAPIAIAQTAENVFTLDLSALTAESGYYVLTVHTAGITDTEGYNGLNGKMVGWSQRVDGTVAYKVIVSPADAGSVTPDVSGTRPYGSELTLTAEAAAGFDFAGWYRDSRLVAAEPTASFTLDAPLTAIEARFSQSVYDVTVSADLPDGGIIEGDGNGKRNYGDRLNLRAVPAQYHEFTGWTVNGEPAGSEAEIEVTVTGNTDVVAHFAAIERVTIDYDLKAGWNWLSFGVADESLGDINNALGSLYLGRELRGGEGTARRAVNWDGALQALQPQCSYRLNMVADGAYSLTGEPLNDATITLTQGWNWLGYLPTDALTVADAFALVPATAGDVLKGQDAFALYDGQQWIGSLTTMELGAGYMYYSTDTQSFGFPAAHMATRSRVAARATLGRDDAPWSYDPYKYPDNMAVNASVANMTVSDGTWIGAFIDGECRGAAPVLDGVFYLTVHGDVEESEIELRLYDKAADADLWAPDAHLAFNGNRTAQADAPLLLNVYQTGIGRIDDGGAFTLYPVPATDVLHIDGAAHVDRLTVRSVNGRQMVLLHDTDVSNGIDVSRLDSGVYVLSIETGGTTWSRTFVKK